MCILYFALQLADLQLSLPCGFSVGAALADGAWGQTLGSVEGLDNDMILLLFLVRLRTGVLGSCDGYKQQWRAFIEALDAAHLSGEAIACPPCAWPPDQRSWLGPTEAAELAEEAAAGLEEAHEALFPALSDAYPDHFPQSVYTLSHFRWAGGVLAAFAIQLRLPSSAEVSGQIAGGVPSVRQLGTVSNLS